MRFNVNLGATEDGVLLRIVGDVLAGNLEDSGNGLRVIVYQVSNLLCNLKIKEELLKSIKINLKINIHVG